MENSFLSYMSKRLKDKDPYLKNCISSGPVITISREVGCNGTKLARLIANKLNKQHFDNKWKVLSKEIFYESAKELNINYDRISKVFKNADRYTFEEILKAFNEKNYKSERKIIKTVTDVVHSFAVDGFCIIVGRGGHIIAKDIKNALHIRLVAPLDYRINTIMENNGLNHGQAIQFINKVEKERIAFRKALKEHQINDKDYDLIINRASFDNQAIVTIIENIILTKKMLSGYKEKVLLF